MTHLRYVVGGHVGDVEEDAAKMFTVGKHIGLHGQEGTARVN